MNKYILIYNLRLKQYLRAVTTNEYTPEADYAGTWPNEHSALRWIENIKNEPFTLVTMYKGF